MKNRAKTQPRPLSPKYHQALQTITLSALGLTTLVLILSAVFLGDPEVPSPELSSMFFREVNRLFPEAGERTVFLVSLFSLPVLVFGSALLAIRHLPKIFGNQLNQKLTPFLMIALSLFGAFVLTTSQLVIYHTGWEDPNIAGYMVGLVVASAVFYGLLHFKFLRDENPSVARAVMGLIFGASALSTIGMRSYGMSSVIDEGPFNFHLEAILYTVTQSVAGRTPIRDFPSLYGMYGELLVPWFKLIGLSVATFTLTMNTLLFAATSAVLYVLRKHIRNHGLYLLSGIAFLWFTLNWHMVMVAPDSYFQYWPLRFLFPALTLLGAELWLSRPARSTLIAVSIMTGISLIWNFESGIAATGAWVALLFYKEALNPSRREALRTLATAGLAILAPLVVFQLWLCLQAQAWINPVNALSYHKIFYLAGYFMLPMPRELHPWMAVALLYTAGLSLGALKFFKVLNDPRIDRIFFITILGFGLFPYYQGRSHDAVLTAAVWPSYVLGLMFLSAIVDLVDEAIEGREPMQMIAPMIPAGITLLALVLVGNLKTLTKLSSFEQYLHAHWSNLIHAPMNEFKQNVMFIKNEVKGDRKAVIFDNLQASYYAETGLVSPLQGAGIGESYLVSDLIKIREQLTTNPPAHLFVGTSFLPGGQNGLFEKVMGDAQKHYQVAALSPSNNFIHFVRTDIATQNAQRQLGSH